MTMLVRGWILWIELAEGRQSFIIASDDIPLGWLELECVGIEKPAAGTTALANNGQRLQSPVAGPS